ncbi:hypothetical protein [Actinomadura sp. J1-007]|uniref:hypothetical protein n=1 Tax=Actinomadura sp. J1-007 TaxID=2661913 RepID=UPI001F4F8B61|nr:hypothetical protein [Actinomadura sp. J1-007]
MSAFTLPIIDGLTVARRNAIKIRRSPEQLAAAVALPAVLILLFAYVFGSAIDIPGCPTRSSCSPASSSRP